MSLAVHCDLATCDTWARGAMAKDFVTVLEGDRVVGHYCSGWHAVTALAEIYEPSREVEL